MPSADRKLAGSISTGSAHEMAKGPNGGPVVDTTGHHVETVAKGTDPALFLSDAAEKPVAASATKNARAVVQDGGKSATAALQPAEPDRLVGSLVQPLSKGARVVVSVTMPDGRAVQARFVNNRPQEPSP